MDRFCIDRGTLLDNSRVQTLVGPEQHSMHCLLDVSLCVNSGFTVLGDPEVAGGKYTVAAQFDDDGSDVVFDFAAKRGRSSSCNDCTGELGDFTRGFRAAVVGIVEDVGNPNSSDPLDRAPSITVTSVMDSSDGCASFTCPTVDPPTLAAPAPPPSPVPTTSTEVITALPTASPKAVNCNEFQSVVTLNESPLVTLEFVVNVPGNNSNYDFTDEEVAAGGVMSALLSYDGVGYVALATSTDPFMPNSEAIMCLPDDEVPVSKYFLGERSQAAVVPVDDSAQTLLNTEIIQTEGKTKCLFRKLLNEDGEIPIDPNGKNTFIWAIGRSNALSYHLARGSVTIPFEQCNNTLEGVSEVREVAFEQVKTYDTSTYWKAHGILMGLAWGFFAPVAIVSAICRRLIPGEGVWFQIHRAANTLCCILTIAGFGLAVAAYSRTGSPHFSGTHQRVGLTIFVLVLLQVLNGMLRPHIDRPSGDALNGTAKDTDSDEEQAFSDEKESITASIVNFSLRRSRAHTPKTDKTVSRFTWEVFHRSIGLALLGMGLYNGYTGLMLYAMRTGNATDYTNVWWGWTGAILGFALLYSVYDRCVAK